MIYYISELEKAIGINNAAPKARADIDTILNRLGFKRIVLSGSSLNRASAPTAKRVQMHFESKGYWNDALDQIEDGGLLFIQFPPRNHSVFMWPLLRRKKQRGLKIALIIHDLDCLRYRDASIALTSRLRMSTEEVSLLKLADAIISHNEIMSDALIRQFSINADRIINLGLFDYLCEDELERIRPPRGDERYEVAIAGNLSQEKSGYIYDLPEGIMFNLYGSGYRSNKPSSYKSINYYGSFDPDDLPSALKGDFGLIWDGGSRHTCEGMYGNYLKINNPHKTSLYLVSGLPIIVWKEAAVANRVVNEGLGIAIESLDCLPLALNHLSDDEYWSMVNNVKILGDRLKKGHFTLDAIRSACSLLNCG